MLDFRDYLDGQPIHNGNQLLLWHDGQWIWVRYELVDLRTRAVDLHSVRAVHELDRSMMRFRWPTSED